MFPFHLQTHFRPPVSTTSQPRPPQTCLLFLSFCHLENVVYWTHSVYNLACSALPFPQHPSLEIHPARCVSMSVSPCVTPRFLGCACTTASNHHPLEAIRVSPDLGITNKATVNICVQASRPHKSSFLWDKFPGVW